MTRPKFELSLILVAAAIAGAPALAEYAAEHSELYDFYAEPETPVEQAKEAAPIADEVPVTTIKEAPVVEEVQPQPANPVIQAKNAPSIEVTAPPLTQDQAINRDVVEILQNNPRLTGKIGVETRDREVTLTGVVVTPGQVYLAANDARSVEGVRYVYNQLRSKVGYY
jgi:osmotically-inducible protein OsmY